MLFVVLNFYLVMMEINLFVSLLLCFLVVVICHFDVKKPCDRYKNITCPCGHSGNVVVPAEMCDVTRNDTVEKSCEPCQGPNYLDQLCQKLRNCETCIKIGDFCMKGLQGRVKRNQMRKDRCIIPSWLTNANVKCDIFPDEVFCNSTCIYGYTYPEGIHVRYHCKYSDNIWIPRNIMDCYRYVNCELIVVNYAAQMKCVRYMANTADRCNISCSAVGNYPAVPEQLYTCGSTGMWHPHLPWCVKKRPDVFTLRPPIDRH